MSEVKRYNIRMAGIGGQGVVTASHIVSNGVVISGGFSSLVFELCDFTVVCLGENLQHGLFS